MILLSNYWTSSPQTESRGKKCFTTEQKNPDIMTETIHFKERKVFAVPEENIIQRCLFHCSGDKMSPQMFLLKVLKKDRHKLDYC